MNILKFGALPCFDPTQILETVNSGQFIGYMTFPPLHLTNSRIYALRIDIARMRAKAENPILLSFCCVAVRFVKMPSHLRPTTLTHTSDQFIEL